MLQAEAIRTRGGAHALPRGEIARECSFPRAMPAIPRTTQGPPLKLLCWKSRGRAYDGGMTAAPGPKPLGPDKASVGDSQVPSPPESLSVEYNHRLARLVRRLLEVRFRSAKDLWTLQVKLLELQRDLQASIRDAKGHGKSGRDNLAELRAIRWHARRFGDALAWVLLGLERQLIYPLARNDPVPIPSNDHGHRGVEAIATALSGEEWGFPLLHDITDCLRIGDITFIRPGAQNTTVEVKTRLVGQRAYSDSRGSYEYEITVIAPGEPPFLPPVPQGDRNVAGQSAPEDVSCGGDRRAERQLRRLHIARLHQTAEHGTVNDIDGSPVVTVAAGQSSGDHAGALQRIVRKARRNGYGSEAVDDAFLYCALYDPDGIDAERLPALFEGIAEDLITSGVLFDDDPSRNSLVVCSVPSPEGRAPQLYLPYFLLPLPKTSILDILHGRMVLFNLVNSGRVVQALEDAGFDVHVPTGRNDLASESFVVGMEVRDEQGHRFRAEMHNLKMHLDEMTMEFRSLRYIIDVALAMRKGLLLAIERGLPPAKDGHPAA